MLSNQSLTLFPISTTGKFQAAQPIVIAPLTLKLETDLNAVYDKADISKLQAEDIPQNFNLDKKHDLKIPVVSQGTCGSCWAYAISMVASYLCSIEAGELIVISPYSVVSTVSKGIWDNSTQLGCCGGHTNKCVEFLTNKQNSLRYRALLESRCSDDSWIKLSEGSTENTGGSEFNESCDNPSKNSLNMLWQEIQGPPKEKESDITNVTCYSSKQDFNICSLQGFAFFTTADNKNFESARKAIQSHIMDIGPVLMSVPILLSFMSGGNSNYKSDLIKGDPTIAWQNGDYGDDTTKGIYISGDFSAKDIAGGHAITIIGWGKEKDIDFWIIKNSWGDQWGDKGYCKIAMWPHNKFMQIEVKKDNIINGVNYVGSCASFELELLGKREDFNDIKLSQIREESLNKLLKANADNEEWLAYHQLEKESFTLEKYEESNSNETYPVWGWVILGIGIFLIILSVVIVVYYCDIKKPFPGFSKVEPYPVPRRRRF